jgi:hypothetical protein
VDKSQLEFIDTLGFTKFPKYLHVTLAHSRTDLHKYWSLQEKKNWSLDIKSICYNENIMAITLKNFVFPIENVIPHITIAMTPDTKPFESNSMLEDMYRTHKTISLDMKITAFGPVAFYN